MTRQNASLTQSYWPSDKTRDVLAISIGEALRRAAAAAPHRTALVEVVPKGFASLAGAESTDRRWTYQQLLDEAEGCAHWLRARFSPGERICIWAPNVPEWVILQYGAALAGLVLVTANPAYRDNELRYTLRQSKAVGLIYASEFRGTDMAAIAREVAGEVREMMCLADWHYVVRGHSHVGTLPPVSPDGPAQVQYTSGTTGRQKGAVLHHMGLVTNASFVATRAGLDRGVLVCPFPLFHTAGSGLGVLGCATTLSTLVLPLAFDPETVLGAIERERGEVLYGSPTMQIALLEHLESSRHDVSSLRVSVCGGAPVPPSLVRRVEEGFGCDSLTIYGQTELSPVVTQTTVEDSSEDRVNTVGRPLWQVELRIADPADDDTLPIGAGGETLPVGAEGEVQARGYQRMIGYLDMPGATAQTITADGWLRTGDLGTMDERGFVRITGRLKDMIIRGGENVYPVEVEARLLEYPAVSDVAVFGVPDPKWGEVVAAAVRLREGHVKPSASELRAHCRAKLAPQKAPTMWFLCPAFPLTASGKVQKFRLREEVSANNLDRLE